MKPRFELAQIIRDYGQEFISRFEPLKHHYKVLHAIKICRTSELGGHVDRCSDCKHERIAYNSCRNRHCPKCQTTNRERWVLARKEDLLDCKYFHVVFTIPQELNAFCLKYPKEMYNILFQSSKETLMTFGNDTKHLGAQMGMIALLHTWGQNLQLHPHIHLIVPGGGFTAQGRWKITKSKGEFLYPIKAVSMVYRAKFMEMFRTFLLEKQGLIDLNLRRTLYAKNWIIYAKQPLIGPEQVIEYLGRYSHKIAISNHRIMNVSDGNVTFSYKDYRQNSTTKTMTLTAMEFLRRFCLHILPPKFVKIRHYGFLANRAKQKLKMEQFKKGKLPTPKQKLDYKIIAKTQLGFDVDQCPCCKTGRMIRIMNFDTNTPPIINDKRYKNDKISA